MTNMMMFYSVLSISRWSVVAPSAPEGMTSKVLRSSYWICWQIWCVHRGGSRISS